MNVAKVAALYFAAALSIEPAFAQDVTAAALAATASTDPQAYVTTVQTILKEKGYLSGEINGLLSRRTLSAINRFCGDQGIRQKCARGPLSGEGAAALSAALIGPTPTLPATPLKAGQELPAAGWLGDNRGGLVFEILGSGSEAGADFTEVHLHGTATEDGYINLYFSPVLPSAPGDRWSFELGAAVKSGVAHSTTITARIAVFGAGRKYLGELAPGVSVKTDSLANYAVTGTAKPTDTVGIQPYVQARYKAGEKVEAVLRFAHSTILKGSTD